MNNHESPDHIEYIRTEIEYKDWSNEEIQELNSSLKICCIALPRKLFLFAKYVAPTLLLLFSFAADIFSGLGVAIRHYEDDHIWWFSLTLVFLCAPAVMFIAHAIFSTATNPEIPLRKKLLWIILHISTGAGFLLMPLWGYVKKLYHAIRAVVDEDNSMIHLEKFHSTASVDDNVHKLYRAFLQSAPQLLLQLYILLSSLPGKQDVNTVIAEVISVLFSLNALTVVVVHFEVNSKHHPSRTASTDRAEEVNDLCCVVIEYLWWFFSITARVLALAFFATVFKYWVFVICAIHAGTVSTCLIFNHPRYTLNKFVISIFMGLVYIFCFMEYKVDFGLLGRVMGLYGVYYAFTFSQNVCMVLSAYFLSEGDASLHLPVVIVHFLCFFLGVVFMLFYLGLLRPLYLALLKHRRELPHA